MNILRKIKESSFYTNKCLINGAWISSDGVNTIDVTNPYDGVVIDSIPVVTKIQISEAIEAAYLAQSKWSATTPSYKREMIHRWKDLILSNIDLLAMLMTLEQGKPLSESVGEINYTASYLDYYADEAIRIYGDVLPPPFPNSDVIVLKEPIGVVGIIAPWNFPIAMFMRKVAPALASGCTCVVKPDEKTPLTAFAMMELACQAGFPKGVINCITGNPQEIGEELSYSKKVRKISFTGSAEVGKLLMKQSASTVKKITLELGGNAPFIVFNDANLEAAAKGLVASKFRNAGQTCVCANRVYIHKDIYDDFCNMLKIEIESLKIGNGIDEGVNVGPIIDDEAVIKIKSFVDASIDMGASLIYGGKIEGIKNNLYHPTIIGDVKNDMPIMKYEVFGPILSLAKFQSDEELIKMANDTDYGLACYFYTESIKKVSKIMKALEYGIVGVNTGLISSAQVPFGGVKESGFGREGSKYGIDDYTVIKYICIQN